MDLQQQLADYNANFKESAPTGAAAFLNSKIEDLTARFPFDRVVRVGDPAPEFSLPGAAGDSISLPETAGGPVVLTFCRDACCPLSMTEKNSLTFEVPSEAGNDVARKFGLVYQMPDDLKSAYVSFGAELAAANGDGGWELPVPATFVIGRDGHVKLSHAETDYRKRLSPEAIIDAPRATTA